MSKKKKIVIAGAAVVAAALVAVFVVKRNEEPFDVKYETAKIEKATIGSSVTQVRQEGTTEDNVVTYEVVISAPNKELKLKPGLTANVTIYTLERTGIVSVPTKALRFTPTRETVGPKDKIVDCDATHKLWTRQGRTFTAHAVTTGISNGTRTEITGGLPEGTVVITDMVAADEADETAETTTERSPFAPGPPEKKKK